MQQITDTAKERSTKKSGSKSKRATGSIMRKVVSVVMSAACTNDRKNLLTLSCGHSVLFLHNAGIPQTCHCELCDQERSKRKK